MKIRVLHFLTCLLLLSFFGGIQKVKAQNGPTCDTYTNKTTTNGLGNSNIFGVYAVGSTVYAATNGGLSISTDGGANFTNKTTDDLGVNTVLGVYAVGSSVYAATSLGLSRSTDNGASFTKKTTSSGLGNNYVRGVHAIGNTVYAATIGGLSISTDGGSSFTNKTTSNGLGSNSISGVYAIGSTVYVATLLGLSISTDGGSSFTNKTTSNGLGNNGVFGVYAVGSTVYAATAGGLSISTDGGSNFTNKTTANGLGNNIVKGVYAVGSTVYAATSGGLSISTDGGATFTNKTTSNGLGGNTVNGVYILGSTIYAATGGGLSYCSVPICTPPTNGGTIAAAQSGTNPFTPAAFTSSAAASGETGTLEYKWQSSTTSNSGGFSDIASSNADTYTAGALTVTTWFKRLARVSCSSDWTGAVASNVIEATVSVSSTNGPTCDTYTNKTTTNGLGNNLVFGVYASGNTVYAVNNSGVSISTNGGASFTNKTTANGLGQNVVYGVYAVGSTVYAATFGGLSISTDGGSTFTNKTTANGLGHNTVNGVYAVGSTVYAATQGGVSISTDGGSTFTNRTTSNGLGNNIVYGVYAVGSTVYAATNEGGLSISTDGGASFTNKTTANGLGNNTVRGVYAVGSTVYAATNGGLSISTDGGTSFSNYTTTNGLGNNTVRGVSAVGSTVYAATSGGLSISTDGGTSFSNYTTTNGLGNNTVRGVYVVGNKIYAATLGGLSYCSAVICTPPTSGGTIAAAQSGTSPFTPAAFTSSAAASGETGTLEYKWQSSTTSNSTGFADIASSNADTYTAGALTVTTWFKRLARVSCSSDWTGAVASNVIEVTVSSSVTNGPTCDTYTNKTTANGLGDEYVNGVYAEGSTVYAATDIGLSISTDGGANFTNKKIANGLGDNSTIKVYASGSTVYVATTGGLSISTDGGASFTNKTTANGLANNNLRGVYAVGSTVYAASGFGLSISTDGGTSFTNRTTSNGLGNNIVNGVYAVGSTVYAATYGGLSISTDGGSTFTNKTTTNGLGSNDVRGVYAVGSTVYAATYGGLSISTDGGASFTNKTTSNGLGNNIVNGVYAVGSTVYAGTDGGLSISTDGGASFTNKTTSNGLGDNEIQGVYASGNTIYVATGYGLSYCSAVVCTPPTSGGTIAAAQSGTNPFTPAAFTSSAAASGETGTLEYKWQSSTTSNSGGFSDIASSNADTYTAGALTVTTWFKRLARVSCSADWTGAVESNVIEVTVSTSVTNGPVCNTYTNKTTANGLGDNTVLGVYVSGSTVYAGTIAGLSKSTDGGSIFTSKTTSNGLGNNIVFGVYAIGNTVYAATLGGLSISTDDGASFTNKTTSNGLGNNVVTGVYADGSKIYAATAGGLSISTNGGTSFSNKTVANSNLGSNTVNGVYAVGSTVYVANSGGLSISTDGGANFTNKNTLNGLGNNTVLGVYATGSTVYAATAGGLSISTDGGANFTNKTTANGLGDDYISAVYAVGSTVYAGTNLGLSISTDGGANFTNKTTSDGLGGNTVSGVYASSSTVYAATDGGLSYCSAVVCTPPTSGGTIAAAQSGTNPFTPAAFTSSVAASGETGTLEYKWQSSTTSNSTGFADIASSNAATYTPGALTQTTWFKRLARVSCTADWTGAVSSNVIEVTVTTLASQPIAQPTNLYFTNTGASSPFNIVSNFTAATSAAGYIVVRKTGAAPSFVPVDGTSYSAGPQGSDEIVYVGNLTSATDYAVTDAVDYYYAIYAYNGSGGTINYLTTSPLTGNAINKSSNSQAIGNSAQSTSVGFPTAGVNVTFPNGTTGSTISATKTNSIPTSNFSVLPGVRGVANQYFSITSSNASPGTYTLILDFSSLGLTNAAWNNFKILKRTDATAPWIDIITLGATITNRQTDGVWGKFTITGLTSFSEFTGGAASSTITVTSAAETGTGSLKQAIIDATDGDFINFDVSAMGSNTITLTSPIVINKNITIQGIDGGIILDGNNATRVMDIADTKVVRLERLKIVNGNGNVSYAGGIWNNGDLTMVNCVVSGNKETGNYGVGGIVQYSFFGAGDDTNDILNLINCTITANDGTSGFNDGFGGLSVVTGISNIYNTIIYGNTGDGDGDIDRTTAITEIKNSCIGNLSLVTITNPGVGNIDTDPAFVGSGVDATHPYAITNASPAADAGDNAYNFDATDIRGGAFGRKKNKTDGTAGTIDMGAYEFSQCINPTAGGTISAAQSGTNPFTPAAFTSSATASGQVGTLEYKWQSSTTNSTSGFSDIASSNAATYTAGALTQTTWFKRLARVSCSADWTGAVESNVIEVTVSTSVTNGPTCDTYTSKTTANGLGSNNIFGVYAVGNTVYASTQGGLSISTDGGTSFSNKTTTNGLADNFVFGVSAVGSTIYVGTFGGLSISTDGGASFTNKKIADGLGSNMVYGVYAVGSTVYAATTGGLSISTDGGSSFTNKTTANGLGNNTVYGVYVVGNTVYAATTGGLSISTDGGSTFTNKTTTNGLGNNVVFGVYAVGSTVYAATDGGLSVTTDGGATFTNKTTSNGLGSNNLYGVYAIGSTVYVATKGGLSISTDGGSSFTNKTTANGLVSNTVKGVYTSGSTIYAATNSGLSYCSAVSSTNTWTGTTNNLWNVGSNWSLGTVPTSTETFTITTGNPQLNVDFTVGGNMTISGTGTLTVNAGNTLSVAGGGTADFGGKSVTFKSNATGTAQLGQMLGTLSNAGNVTMERYIPARRAFRFIAAPVTTTTSIKQNWMENATLGTTAGYPFAAGSVVNPTAGYGTHITGTSGNANGFDATVNNNASLFTFNNGWITSTNTNATLAAGDAYRLFVRGDRGTDLNNNGAAPSATVLRTTGTPFVGTKNYTMSATAGAWNLVGNPYQATIDGSLANFTNITPYYYAWDPKVGTRGAYVAYDFIGGINSFSGSQINEYFQPGQAFFVQTDVAGAASGSVDESMKASAANQTAVFRAAVAYPMLTATLNYTDSLAKNAPAMDGFKLLFDNNFSNSVDRNDAQKLTNQDENISINQSGTLLSIEKRQLYNAATEIAISTSNYVRQQYTVQLSWSNPIDNGFQAQLVDNYTNTTTPIAFSGNTNYSYTVDNAIAASKAADRFKIVFVPNATLPVSGIELGGTATDKQVKLSFKALNEREMANYAIERSADGISFTNIGTQQPLNAAQASVSYSFVDNQPIVGNNYYRIKGSSINGQIQFSNVAMVKYGVNMASVTVVPNPIQGRTVNLRLSQLAKGNYHISVTDAIGRSILKKEMLLDGSSLVQLGLPSSVKAGNYFVKVDGQGNAFIQSFIIQ